MSIRTTMTLEEDVLERVKAESRQRGESLEETLNRLLRFAVSEQHAPVERPKFKVRPFHNTGAILGLNFDKINELLDYVEGEDRKSYHIGIDGSRFPAVFGTALGKSARRRLSV